MLKIIKKTGIFAAVAIIIINIVLWGDMVCEIISLQIYDHKTKKKRKPAEKF